jgi:hypothetical protein
MSERGILSLKPDLRLEQRGQHGQDKPDEPDHRGNLADSSLNKPELGFRYTQRKTFLRNHADGIAALDLFVVPTISFRLLYGLLIMGHGRRQVI